MSQYFNDYMALCSTSELHDVAHAARDCERQARREGNSEMISYHAWARFYAERELRRRDGQRA